MPLAEVSTSSTLSLPWRYLGKKEKKTGRQYSGAAYSLKGRTITKYLLVLSVNDDEDTVGCSRRRGLDTDDIAEGLDCGSRHDVSLV